MSCGCGHNDCGCETVKGRRGPRGLQGPAGTSGQNAQLLYGLGVPLTSPPVTTAPAQWMDTGDGGHYWMWSIAGQNWVDTGVQVQGDDGAPGTNGTNGINAFTTTTAPFTMPNEGTFVVVPVVNNTWAVPVDNGPPTVDGQMVFVFGAGYMMVGGVSGSDMILVNVEHTSSGVYAGNVPPGTLVPSGARVSPAGIQGPPGLPMQVSSGSGVPSSDLGQYPGLYLQVGGTYWWWNTATQAWTNTSVPVGGPPGPAGYTPQTTSGTGIPSGGNNGDIYFQQVNPGFVRVWYKAGGVWVSGPTVLGNRLLGFSNSNPTPNPGSLPANSGDYWWTQIGTFVTMWVYDGSSWVTALSFSTSGGGGTGDLPTVIANTTGQLSGSLPVHWQRTNYRVAKVVTTTTNGGTIQFDTVQEYHDLSILHETVFLNYTDPPANEYSEWVFMLTNNMPSTQAHVDYTANQWKAPADVVVPEELNPGESCILHCYFYKGYMWVSKVDQNPTIL